MIIASNINISICSAHDMGFLFLLSCVSSGDRAADSKHITELSQDYFALGCPIPTTPTLIFPQGL